MGEEEASEEEASNATLAWDFLTPAVGFRCHRWGPRSVLQSCQFCFWNLPRHHGRRIFPFIARDG